MTCLFCNSKELASYNLPLNYFNGKSFSHLICKNCRLLNLDPIPNKDDLRLMYSESYHGEVLKSEIDSNKKMPGLRFKYSLHYQLIKTYASDKKLLLDFGCGNGHFVYNASLHGIKMDGVEFSDVTVDSLKKSHKGEFNTVENFYKNNESYDLIRLGNVLEHFTSPIDEFKKLMSKLNANGVVLIEGPIEMNRSFVNFCKWRYFKLRKIFNKNYATDYPPVHIFFSNYDNQKRFFEQNGLITEYYKTVENSWPYPENVSQINSPGALIKFLIAKLSTLISFVVPKYGNTFIYVGRKKQ